MDDICSPSQQFLDDIQTEITSDAFVDEKLYKSSLINCSFDNDIRYYNQSINDQNDSIFDVISIEAQQT